MIVVIPIPLDQVLDPILLTTTLRSSAASKDTLVQQQLHFEISGSLGRGGTAAAQVAIVGS